MSLINDALKRAKQAPATPVPNLQFRPADPPPAASARPGVLWPIVLTGAGLLILVFVWHFSRPGASPAMAQAAAVVSPEPAAPAPAQIETSAAANAATSSERRAPAEQPGPAHQASVPTPAVTALSNNASTTPVAEAVPAVTPTTNSPSSVAPPPPAFKLQGIVFNPRMPSAVVNGRTLFIGDRIRDFHVKTITQDSVTLVGATQTKVLSLSD